ncbi:MAG: PRC-barrel domain-containing protein [Wenzhouxiangella sp.]
MNTLNTLKCMKCAAVLVPALVLGMPLANAMIGSDLDGQSTDQRAMGSDRSGMHASAHNGYLNALPARGYHSDSLIGAEVKNRRNDETIGKVSNLALDEDGQVIAVIVGVGGLMSIGERDVAIAWDQIERKVAGDEVTLSIDMTEEALKDAPKYSSDRKDSRDPTTTRR